MPTDHQPFNARDSATLEILCNPQDHDYLIPATWHILMECGAKLAERFGEGRHPINWEY